MCCSAILEHIARHHGRSLATVQAKLVSRVFSTFYNDESQAAQAHDARIFFLLSCERLAKHTYTVDIKYYT